MATNNRTFNLDIIIVYHGSSHLKDLLLDTLLAPAHVASVSHSKVTKALGWVTPGDIDAITIEHTSTRRRLFLAVGNPDYADSAGEHMLDSLLLIITESIASGSHRIPFQ